MQTRIDQIKEGVLPKHVAIIMDGNGRWATMQGKQRVFGHQSGTKAVQKVVEMALRLGISYLTLYAFSKENWTRPKEEVDALMELFSMNLCQEKEALIKQGIRLQAIGELQELPLKVQQELQTVIQATAAGNHLTLTLALNYSARHEILNAVKKIQHACTPSIIEKMSEQQFEAYLYTAMLPDPDLLIRTSGEMRLSNFLLWQSAYTELYFTSVLWPNFQQDDFLQAIQVYQSRERKFGALQASKCDIK